MNDEQVANEPQELQFLRLLRELLPFLLERDDLEFLPGEGIGADLIVELPNRKLWLIEAKVDAPSTPDRLERIARQLHIVAERLPNDRHVKRVLATPGVLGREGREILSSRSIELWDGRKLRDLATRHNVETPPGIHLAMKMLRGGPGDRLLRRLHATDPGHPSWLRYQKLCGDILAYLFCPPLEQPLTENPNATGVNKRDFILPNYAVGGFWAFVRDHYRADFVVVDAKNFTGPVGKTEILQVSNYLTRHGSGLFGLIMTRLGIDDGANWTQREQWILHSKMIVALTDDDVRQMIATKQGGQDPSSTIRQKVEDFRLDL